MQTLAIVVAATIVIADLQGLIPPAVCLVVDLHFFLLADTFRMSLYRLTAGALCAVAIIGIVVLTAASEETVHSVVGLGAALVLWVTAVLSVDGSDL